MNEPFPLGLGYLQEHHWNEQCLAQSRPALRWRLWNYPVPAVVLGCAQRTFAEHLPASDIPVVVRGSGGGAVLVGPWLLGLSLIVPASHQFANLSIVESYRSLGKLLSQCLLDFQVRAQVATAKAQSNDPHDFVHWACFGSVSVGEISSQGKKFVGLAQQRRRNGVLFVAGILCEPSPWHLLCRRLGQPMSDAERLRNRTTCVQELIGVTDSVGVLPRLGLAIDESLHQMFS